MQRGKAAFAGECGARPAGALQQVERDRSLVREQAEQVDLRSLSFVSAGRSSTESTPSARSSTSSGTAIMLFGT